MSIAEKLLQIAENQVAVFDTAFHEGVTASDQGIWSCLTNAGTRTNYAFAFRSTDFSTYSFIRPICPGKNVSAEGMFKTYKGFTLPKNLDLSNIPVTTTHGAFFFSTNLVEIEDINIPALHAYHNFFYGSAELKKIHILRVTEKTTFFQTFDGCTSLEEIYFQGTIGRDISFSSCPNLTAETILHVIDRLKDYSLSSKVYTLTLGEINLSKLTDIQQQKALDKGWLLV